MLGQEKLVAMLGTSKPKAAKAFFEDVLGLTFVGDYPHALIFRSGETTVMVQKMETVSPPLGTALGWNVADFDATLQALAARGVVFERFPGMNQDEMGVWRPAGPGSSVAWFRDPDGNLLSISRSPA